MKNLLKSMALGVGVFSMLALASCSNEESVTNPEPNPAPEGYANVTVVIPGFNDGTRAANDVPVTENNIKELWFCAFAVDGDPNAQTHIENLVTPSGTVSGTYESKGSVTLKHGKYHIYVLANVNDYLTTAIQEYKGTGTKPEESSIQNLALTFDGKMATLNATTPYLPMVCVNTKIKEGDNSNQNEVSGGVFVVDGNKNLYADLSLLVAKVRYTLLFDHTDYSNKFFSPDNVDFTAQTAKNIRKATKLAAAVEPTSASDYITGSYSINLDKRTYPSDPDNTYFSTTLTTPPDDLTGGWTESTTQTKRAWQGLVYLPENNISTESGQVVKTLLDFTPKTESNMGGNHQFKLNLERGKYYDVVARIKTPAQTDYTVSVYVKINPWEYVPAGEITDW